MKTPFIEPLTRRHDKGQFDCGKPSLNNYLRNNAIKNQERNLGQTFVAVQDDEPTVMGYYTLAASKVAYADWPEDKKLPPNQSIPTVLLGRLAVCAQFKGRKLGELLLFHAMWSAERIARQIGAKALEVDVLDQNALAFYERYDFQLLKDHPLHVFLPMETIRALELDFSPITRTAAL